MDEKKKKAPSERHGENAKKKESHHEVPKPGRSQSLKDDEMTTEDLVGTSNYERAESDQSKGIFAKQTEQRNRILEEILENDDENAKDRSSDYMDELREESEALGRPLPYLRSHPNRHHDKRMRH